MTDLMSYVSRGGVVMIAILICSVIALAVFLQRLWALRADNVLPEDARQRALEALRRQDYVAAASAAGPETSFGRLLRAALADRELDEEALRRELEEVGRRELSNMERFTGLLGTLATITPLLGLLGTIIGMILTFRGVQETAASSGVTAGAMADGIWQALLTTAAGLIVAIPCFLAHRYILARVDRWALLLEEVTGRVVRLLYGKGERP